MNKPWLISLLVALQLTATPISRSLTMSAQAAETQTASSVDTEKRSKFVADLMSKMTLEEKIGQMNLPSIGEDVTGPVVSKDVDAKIKKGLVGGIFNTVSPSGIGKLQKMAVEETRLKIPLLFGYDVIHGHRTIFPIPLGLSTTWALGLVQRTARAAAVEASSDGLNWTFSPMVDIARDPRWGRCTEGSGEDPYLGSRIAEAMVRGYQGDGYARADSVLACVKHYALYGGAEAGRDYNTVDMSPVKMFNDYMPPYKAAVDAGVASAMASFNEVNGVPATGNKWLMTDVLRDQWGFKGFIVTDYTGMNEMVPHGFGDEPKVTEMAFKAGIDMDMVGELYLKYGPGLIKDGKVSEKFVEDACRRILEAKYDLGLFEDPYRFIDDERSKRERMSADKVALSKEAATKSMVLLKNENQVLPLNANKKIAFIGPLVKDKRNQLGSWSACGDWNKCVGLWDALSTKFGEDKFLYAKGCNLLDDRDLVQKLNRDGGMIAIAPETPEQLRAEAVKTARKADVVVAVLGEPFCMSGEAASRSMIGLFDQQIELLKALKSTGKPVVLVLMNGRPLTLSWEDENMDAILEAWFAGTMAGPALVDVLFGEVNPQAKLTMTFPINVGQVPIYYNAKNTGRPAEGNQEKYRSRYLDIPNQPLYPFGYGLSYTTFKYGDLSLSASTLNRSGSITVSTTVTNTGKRAGVETVQMYVRDLVGTITRPVKELKGFQQIKLEPGQSKNVTFTIRPDDLRFYNSDLKFEAEPGDFKVFIGGNSRDVKEANFTLSD